MTNNPLATTQLPTRSSRVTSPYIYSHRRHGKMHQASQNPIPTLKNEYLDEKRPHLSHLSPSNIVFVKKTLSQEFEHFAVQYEHVTLLCYQSKSHLLNTPSYTDGCD